MRWSEIWSAEHEPSESQIREFIGTNLWDDLNAHLQQTYNIRPKLFYSDCSMQDGIWKGWSIKYKKGSKALCTLYPKQGHFLALIPIGLREMNEVELLIPTCTEYTQNLFKQTVFGHTGKSLAFDVTDESILRDIKSLITIRVTAR